jgi:quercetin dioxygenase-like cupin family protein
MKKRREHWSHLATRSLGKCCDEYRQRQGRCRFIGIHNYYIRRESETMSNEASLNRSATLSESKESGMHQTMDERLWQVSDIPNWGKRWLDEVDYATIDHTSFFRDYADRWRPVVLRGACREWPAHEKWTDEYLQQTWGDAKVDIYTAPNPQGGHPDRQAVSDAAHRSGTLRELIQTSEKNWSVRGVTLGSGSPLESMQYDLRDEWLSAKATPVMYAGRRLFIHRGGISPWHPHPHDEHLTFQVKGEKDFVFLSPDQTRLIQRMNENELYSFNVDTRRYPEWLRISPICARLYAGDSVYIPPGWWHTAVAVDQKLGVTLASTWGSSRRAVVRQGIPNMFYKGNRGNLPLLPFAILYGLTGWRWGLTKANPIFRWTRR